MKDSTSRSIVRTLRPLFAATLICWAFGAQALMIENYNGLESDASMVSIPNSDNGTMTVKECNNCERIQLKTNAATTAYVVRDNSGKTATLSRQDFAAQLQLIDNRTALVAVFYEIATNTVTQVRLTSDVPLSSSGKSSGSSNDQPADTKPGNGQPDNNQPASRTGGFSR